MDFGGILSGIGDAAGWVGDNVGWGNVGQLGLGAYSLYNQQQASSQANDYLGEAAASSQEYFDWWKENMAPLQQARSINELQSMGFRQDDSGNWTLSDDVKDLYQTGLDLSGRQMQLKQDLFPTVQRMTQDQLNFQAQLQPQQQQLYENQLGLKGSLQDLYGSQLDFQQDIMPHQQGLYRGQLGLQGTQQDIYGSQLDFQQDIMPQQQELYRGQLGLQGAQQEAALGDIRQYQQNRGVEQEFYDQALEGIDINERMGRAQADVAQAYQGTGDELRLRNSRMGLNPASGAAQATQDQMAANKAADIVGARSRARDQAEDQNFNRLGQAVNVRQRLGPAAPQVSMPQTSMPQTSMPQAPQVPQASMPQAPQIGGGFQPSGNAANAGMMSPSGTLMQAAQMQGQSAQGYGQGAGHFLTQGLSGLGNKMSQQNSGSGYTNQKARQLGLQPVMNNFGLGW